MSRTLGKRTPRAPTRDSGWLCHPDGGWSPFRNYYLVAAFKQRERERQAAELARCGGRVRELSRDVWFYVRAFGVALAAVVLFAALLMGAVSIARSWTGRKETPVTEHKQVWMPSNWRPEGRR
jgi:hypothetical protein